MAYLILKVDYVQGGSSNFAGYIDYMDRDAAKINTTKEKLNFNGFIDYMDRDGAKGSGLFSNSDYNIPLDEVDKIKEIFNYVDKNENFMWRFTFSFEEGFLEKLGLKGEGFIREDVLQDITKKTMQTVTNKGNFLDSHWVGEIHHNTDNTHIHVALVDPSLTKDKGFISGITKVAKSFMANELMHFDDPTIKKRQNEITEIIREEIIPARRNSLKELLSSTSDRDLFLEIFSKLPEDRKHWHYNMNSISDLRPLIDEYTSRFLVREFKDELEDLVSLLKEQGEVQSRYYGGKEVYKAIYVENKIKDLYSRLGNVVLNEMRNLEFGLSSSENINLANSQGASILELFSEKRSHSLQAKIEAELAMFSKDYISKMNHQKMKARLEKGR